MGSKKRGRERLMICDSCGCRVPRDKAVSIYRSTVYSTDLRSADDVRTSISREYHYCPSCGKHKRIYEKKKRQAAQARERQDGGNWEQRPSYRTSYGGYRSDSQHGGHSSQPSQPSQQQASSQSVQAENKEKTESSQQPNKQASQQDNTNKPSQHQGAIQPSPKPNIQNDQSNPSNQPSQQPNKQNSQSSPSSSQLSQPIQHPDNQKNQASSSNVQPIQHPDKQKKQSESSDSQSSQQS